MAKLKWILDLVGENFLVIYDVVADIHKERQLVGDTVVIPYFQDVVKFTELLPADTSSLRDRYCELRWKAVKLLESHGALVGVELIAGDHRWESVMRMTARDPKFSDAVETVEHEMKRLSAQADHAGEIVEDQTGGAVAPLQPLQPLLLPEHVTLSWLVTHVPISFWLWMAGTLVVIFGLGVKFGDQPVLRRLVGESESPISSPAAHAATATDVTFLPTDLEVGLPPGDGSALPVRVDIKVNVQRGSATLTKRAEIVSQSYDPHYVVTDEIQPQAMIISVAPDRPVIREGEAGAKIVIELDRRSIVLRGDTVGSMPAGQKARIGTINFRVHFSISGQLNGANVELPVYFLR